MSMQMTLLDRGLGFRIDAKGTLADEDVRAVTDYFCASDCFRFRYGICNTVDLGLLKITSESVKPAMRVLLKVVDSCPDLLLAVAGEFGRYEALDRYGPLFQEFPWVSHRCRSLDDAMDWVSENMAIRYGVVPDYLRTIPIPHALDPDTAN